MRSVGRIGPQGISFQPATPAIILDPDRDYPPCDRLHADRPPYGRFYPAPGLQLGLNDLKIVEVADLIDAHIRGRNGFPNFREATEVQSTTDAVKLSAKTAQSHKIS